MGEVRRFFQVVEQIRRGYRLWKGERHPVGAGDCRRFILISHERIQPESVFSEVHPPVPIRIRIRPGNRRVRQLACGKSGCLPRFKCQGTGRGKRKCACQKDSNQNGSWRVGHRSRACFLFGKLMSSRQCVIERYRAYNLPAQFIGGRDKATLVFPYLHAPQGVWRNLAFQESVTNGR